MGRTKGIVYTCDGCGQIAAPRHDYELPPGFHGGQVQSVGDGWGANHPSWWACDEECLTAVVKMWRDEANDD